MVDVFTAVSTGSESYYPSCRQPQFSLPCLVLPPPQSCLEASDANLELTAADILSVLALELEGTFTGAEILNTELVLALALRLPTGVDVEKSVGLSLDCLYWLHSRAFKLLALSCSCRLDAYALEFLSDSGLAVLDGLDLSSLWPGSLGVLTWGTLGDTPVFVQDGD